MININWKEYVRDHFNMFGIHYIRNPWTQPGHTWAIHNPNLKHKPYAFQFTLVKVLGKWV